MIALETPASRAMSAMRVADGPRAANARQAAARMFSRAREERSRAGDAGGGHSGPAGVPAQPLQQVGVGAARRQRLLQLALDAQRRLVAHAEVVGQRPRRHVGVALHELPGGGEPGGDAEAGALHEGAGRGIDLGAAVVAGVGATLGDAVEAPHHAAVPAHGAHAVGRVQRASTASGGRPTRRRWARTRSRRRLRVPCGCARPGRPRRCLRVDLTWRMVHSWRQLVNSSTPRYLLDIPFRA